MMDIIPLHFLANNHKGVGPFGTPLYLHVRECPTVFGRYIIFQEWDNKDAVYFLPVIVDMRACLGEHGHLDSLVKKTDSKPIWEFIGRGTDEEALSFAHEHYENQVLELVTHNPTER